MRILRLVRYTLLSSSIGGSAISNVLAQQASPLPLPIPRPLGSPSSMPTLGNRDASPGAQKIPPPSAAFAVTDLRQLDSQLATLFPPSALYYPADSLHRVKHIRAEEWLSRMLAPSSAAGRQLQLVSVAEIAWRSENDTLARRLFDTQLMQLSTDRPSRSTRSLVLAAAIDLFADVTQDSIRLAHNVLIAERYMAALLALPSGGYRTRSDSADVLYRQIDAQLSLIRAADELGASARIVTLGKHLIPCVARLGLRERRNVVEDTYPYGEIATALMEQSHDRAQLDSLEAQLLGLVAARRSDTKGDSLQDHRELTESQHILHERFAAFSLLGRPAPPIVAHAWLNTPDSAYRNPAREYILARGRVRVVAFGDVNSHVVSVLDHLQHEFSSAVDIVFVTHTTGHIGPDLASASDEVAWLATYYVGKRHLTFPIAIWAGDVVPGPYGTRRPRQSPVFAAYQAGLLNGVCIIDGRGTVWAYRAVDTRAHELHLVQQVRALLMSTGAVRVQH